MADVIRRLIRPLCGTLLLAAAGCTSHLQPPGRLAVPMATATSGPLRLSETNPRYFVDRQGKPVFLTGSHTWNSLQDWGEENPPRSFDYESFLALLSDHGHDYTRFFVQEQGSGVAWTASPVWFSPTVYVRSGPGEALDGGLRYDLDRLNPEYFKRLHQRLAAARDRGIYVSVMLFNGWSLGTKTRVLSPQLRSMGPGNPWRAHPFNAANNINGLDGDPNRSGTGADVHTLQLPEVTAREERYVRAVVDAVADLDNVLFEICNECDAGSEEWQYRMIRLVKDYEAARPLRHPVGMTAIFPDGDNKKLLASPADWIAPEDTPTEPFMSEPPALDSKVILSDTDHEGGIAGSVQWVWKTVCRGLNPVYMDPMRAQLVDLLFPMYPDHPPPASAREQAIRNNAEAIRSNFGYARALLSRMDLNAAVPHGELVSSGYALAIPGREYLVFLPGSELQGIDYAAERIRKMSLYEKVSVDLGGSHQRYAVEWLRPSDGRTYAGPIVEGGGEHTFTAPFPRDAVLFLSALRSQARSVSR